LDVENWGIWDEKNVSQELLYNYREQPIGILHSYWITQERAECPKRYSDLLIQSAQLKPCGQRDRNLRYEPNLENLNI